MIITRKYKFRSTVQVEIYFIAYKIYSVNFKPMPTGYMLKNIQLFRL